MSDGGVAARHSSETNEHFTPKAIVEAAREVLGRIDVDPASCAVANEVVQAESFFSATDNGFTRSWFGKAFLNPPGGRCDKSGVSVVADPEPDKGKRLKGFFYAHSLPELVPCEGPAQASAKAWWFKLAREYQEGRVKEAIFVGFSLEILQSTQVDTPRSLTVPLEHSICVPSRRVAYVREDGVVGKSPPHGSVIVYLGDRRGAFARVFQPIGFVR